jgi:hypothetical protein
MDERTITNINHGRGSTIHHTLELGNPSSPDGVARRHPMKIHGQQKVLCTLHLYRSIPGIHCRPWMGKTMGGQGGEQMQVILLDHPTKQTMDGGPTGMSALPQPPWDRSSFDGEMPLFSTCLARVARLVGIALQAPPRNGYRRFKSWWNSVLIAHPLGAQERAQKVIYMTWNIWKERCWRVFDNKGMTEGQLQALIRQDVEQ